MRRAIPSAPPRSLRERMFESMTDRIAGTLLMGLDVAEYEPNLYLPEVATPGEVIVEPDGTQVPSEAVLRTARDEVVV